MRTVLVLLILLTTSCCSPTDHIGVIKDETRNRTIEFQVWLPKHELVATKYPLVLLSHGSGGEYTNHAWLIDSLIDMGFMVAALNHPSNTTGDNTDEGVISVWHRPLDMSLLLDQLLQSQKWGNVIDKNRIGAAGFSSGGYTVLAMLGARYNRELMRRYCSGDERGADCDLASDFSNVDYRDSAESYRDPRIKAVFAMAPSVGPAITLESLTEISQPVFIVAAMDDELVNTEYGAIRYSTYIPTAELELLPEGGHFIFLECNIATRLADWFIKKLDLCGTQFNVNRKEIRKRISAGAVGFFKTNIGEELGQRT